MNALPRHLARLRSNLRSGPRLLPRPLSRRAAPRASGITRALLAALALAGALPAHALYKVVGPDGKITYSDRPPDEAPSRVRAIDPGATGPAQPELPLALREASQRYPVTLYTSGGCTPCEEGRRYLRQRGVPFAERVVSTEAERALLQRTVGGDEVPAVTIGTQAIRGFSSADWGDYLSAAGYPASSVLPASYRPPSAAPLIPPPRVAGEAGAPAAPPAISAPAPIGPAPTPDNPTGIRF